MKEKEVESMGDASYIEAVMPQLEKAAGVVARKWPTVTTPEDLYNDLVVHFLERPGSLEKLAGMEERDQIGVATRVGHDKVSGQRDDHENFTGNFHYAVREVQVLLTRGAILENVDKFQGAAVDLQVAMADLKSKNVGYWNILVRKYTQGEKFNRTSNEAKNLVPRAEELLTTLMNRAHRSAEYEWKNGGGYYSARPSPHQFDSDTGELEGWEDDE